MKLLILLTLFFSSYAQADILNGTVVDYHETGFFLAYDGDSDHYEMKAHCAFMIRGTEFVNIYALVLERKYCRKILSAAGIDVNIKPNRIKDLLEDKEIYISNVMAEEDAYILSSTTQGHRAKSIMADGWNIFKNGQWTTPKINPVQIETGLEPTNQAQLDQELEDSFSRIVSDLGATGFGVGNIFERNPTSNVIPKDESFKSRFLSSYPDGSILGIKIIIKEAWGPTTLD